MATTSPGVTPSWRRPSASDTTSSTNFCPVLRLFPAMVTGKSRREVNNRLRHWQIWAIIIKQSDSTAFLLLSLTNLSLSKLNYFLHVVIIRVTVLLVLPKFLYLFVLQLHHVFESHVSVCSRIKLLEYIFNLINVSIFNTLLLVKNKANGIISWQE